eukprot:1199354-Pyramimonas_sp.AAC.2
MRAAAIRTTKPTAGKVHFLQGRIYTVKLIAPPNTQKVSATALWEDSRIKMFRVFYVASGIEREVLSAALDGALQSAVGPQTVEPVLVPVSAVGSTPEAGAMVLMEVTVLPGGPCDTSAAAATSELG